MTVSDVSGAFPTLRAASLEQTAFIGGFLAGQVFPGLLVLLFGDLGAGKTALVRSMGAALGADRIKSPTFSIESHHPLPGKPFSLVHADLYRLDDASATVLQLEEYLEDGSLVIVEWAERWRLPQTADRWEIRIQQPADAGCLRTIDLFAHGADALSRAARAYFEILGGCAAEGARACR